MEVCYKSSASPSSTASRSNATASASSPNHAKIAKLRPESHLRSRHLLLRPQLRRRKKITWKDGVKAILAITASDSAIENLPQHRGTGAPPCALPTSPNSKEYVHALQCCGIIIIDDTYVKSTMARLPSARHRDVKRVVLGHGFQSPIPFFK